MADKRDYYEVLGVNKNATDDEIKAEYRKKAKKYHPDLNPDDKTAEAKFKDVNEAYEVLSDKDKRAKYDSFGHAGVDPSYGGGNPYGGAGGFGGVDLGDIFSSFFGGGFGGSTRQSANAPRRGGDVRASVALSFMEAAHGCKKSIAISVLENCSQCGGSGAAAGTSPSVCSDCGGSGYVVVQQRTPFGVMQNTRPCSKCQGKGKTVANPCPKCKGSGKVRVKRTLEINIPAGVDDEQTLQVKGRGDVGENGGGAGSVIVIITVRPDLLFERERYDVLVTVPVSYTQAALGAEIVVPSIDGRIKFTVPDGTQSGSSFRLRGKGIPYLNGSGRGDMYVTVNVEVPKKLSREQRAALKELDKSLTVDKNFEQQKGFADKVNRAFGKE